MISNNYSSDKELVITYTLYSSSIDELKNYCRLNSITGYSGKCKSDLVAEVLDHCLENSMLQKKRPRLKICRESD